MAFAAVREGSPLEVARLSAQATLLALTIAVAGWLLISRTSSDTEHRVFAIGTLLLIGGAAAHLCCLRSLPASSPARSGTPLVQSRATASNATCVICIIR